MTKKEIPQTLLGDLSKEEEIARMVRVNHAGEYGARRIYAGQMAVLKDDESYELLKHMYEQELEHLEYFEKEISKRRVRPTALSPLWHGLGYALGFATATLGKRAAMACTVAVEDVIEEHYKEQLERLELFEDEKDLKAKIKKFRDDEIEHRDIGIENQAELTVGYEPLYRAVQMASKVAIWLSKRV